MSAWGQEDQSPPPSLSGRYQFGQATFAGVGGKEEDAPTAVIVNVGSVPALPQLLNPGQTVLSMNTNKTTISVCGLLSRNSRERARI